MVSDKEHTPLWGACILHVALVVIISTVLSCTSQHTNDTHGVHGTADDSIRSLSVESTEVPGKPVWQRGEWIVSTAECPAVNISRQEAMNRALLEARKNAIEYSVGINVSSSELVSRSSERPVLFMEYIALSSYGRIVEERTPVWQEIEQGKDRNDITTWLYRVELTCKVAEERGTPDPGFSLSMSANQMLYREGDTIALSVTATQDCYLTIFNYIAKEDKVYIIFPNEAERDSALKARQKKTIPSPDSSIDFVAMLPDDSEESHEYIIAVATKTPVDFSGGLPTSTVFSVYPTPTAAMTEINRHLADIPLDQRTLTSDVLLIQR